MLFIGGIAAYTFVWDLGDVGIGLMTIFNIIALYPLSGQALKELDKYENTAGSRSVLRLFCLTPSFSAGK